ncbi:hypothetical protein F5B20DRAFT_298188 [Whalleya microplaca]|nr:hypothetical protein F5B20DRAFT_298188 [Whalleya microplaca]
MAAQRMGNFSWTDDAHEKLLLAVWDVKGPFSPEDQVKITTAFQARGYHGGWDAIRQHIGKLKRKEINAGRTSSVASSPAGPAGSGASAAPTPKKGGRAATKTTPAKRKIKGEDDQDDDETPSKKKIKTATFPANFGQADRDQPMPPRDYDEV